MGFRDKCIFINGMAVWLPFVGNYRTFLITPGMPTSDEFANLWALSRSYANSVY